VDEQTPEPCEVIPTCPICGGKMELVYDRPTAKVCVCSVCHTGISVPAKAWDIARARHKAKPTS
jgi:hypothetical protein